MTKSDTNRVEVHYRKMAQVYDRRWRTYLQLTLGEALSAARLGGKEGVLDIGCGTGEFEKMAIERFPQLTIVGVDMSPSMLEKATEKLAAFPQVSFKAGQAEVLPFEAQSFDVVIFANVFHHVRGPETALKECARVLRPGGRLVLVDWCLDFWFRRWLHYWLKWTNPTYVRTHSTEEAKERLLRAGLAVEETRRFVVPPLYGMMRLTARKP